MMFALTVFIVSLLGITTLFSVKLVEARSGRIFFPQARLTGDSYARTIKKHVTHALERLEHVPVQLLWGLRALVHFAALSLASLARRFEGAAEKLAEHVSHKRDFQARETQSDYLKQVRLPAQSDEIKDSEI